MYKIIGADQKEYGPVSIEQMRQWIAEGRVNAQTQAQMVGDTTWKPVSMFPEFAASFPAAGPLPPPPTMGSPVPSPDFRARAMQEVNGPAIGLMITAALGVLAALAGIAFILSGGMSANNFYPGGQSPESMRMMRLIQSSSGGLGIFFRIIGILVCVFIFYGAMKMKKLENFGLCMGASIVAMIPCLSPCCLVGFQSESGR